MAVTPRLLHRPPFRRRKITADQPRKTWAGLYGGAGSFPIAWPGLAAVLRGGQLLGWMLLAGAAVLMAVAGDLFETSSSAIAR